MGGRVLLCLPPMQAAPGARRSCVIIIHGPCVLHRLMKSYLALGQQRVIGPRLCDQGLRSSPRHQLRSAAEARDVLEETQQGSARARAGLAGSALTALCTLTCVRRQGTARASRPGRTWAAWLTAPSAARGTHQDAVARPPEHVQAALSVAAAQPVQQAPLADDGGLEVGAQRHAVVDDACGQGAS